MTDYIKSIDNHKIGGLIADGPWIECGRFVIYEGAPSASFSQSFSLSSYLPDDGCDYLCQFSGLTRTGSSSSNNSLMTLYSGTGSDSSSQIYGTLSQIITRSSSFRINSGSILLPIFANDRNITYTNTGSGTSGNISLWLFRYRRLGTNI